ncbi:MAG: 3'(2'),5'-bisphosphate nucleotidase CysQ [Gemmatimonadota bacterium]|nr:3'(2'),5'-bisphosphate nucleotidase CysQ [Gemmatimonadota bacterium]
MSDWRRELEVARAAALEAGAVLRAARADPGARGVKADGSPVTEADRAANTAILACLSAAFPGDAILSEESADDPARLSSPRVWLVDPLDGTRDFLEGAPDFAVHIALVAGGAPVVAVVHEPAIGRLAEAIVGRSAWLEGDGPRRKLAVSSRRDLDQMRVGVSRFGQNRPLVQLLAETPLGKQALPRGASTKMLDVAAGLLDATICLHGRESEWDTCAPGLVITEAGGRVTDVDRRPLRYNQSAVRHARGVVTSNGRIHDELCRLAAEYWFRDA